MAIPNLKKVEQIKKDSRATKHIEKVILCRNCRKPLWIIKIKGWYGGLGLLKKPITEEHAMPGVKPYREVFPKDKDNGGYKDPDLECPFCKKAWCGVVVGPDKKLICVPTILGETNG